MVPIAKRVLGALLALVGLALTATGVWFVSHLGTTGTATFTTTVDQDGPVVLDPSVLNRVDVPVTLRASTESGNDVWMGMASPADASIALRGGTYTSVTGVEIPDWALSTERHDGEIPPDVTSLDVWGDMATGESRTSLVVEQDGTPATVVVAAPDTDRVTVEASWPKKTWFYQALVLVVAGGLLTLVGIVTAWQRAPKPQPTDPQGRHRGGMDE